MSDFKAKMHPIRFPLALRPKPRWGSLQRSPDPLAVFKGSTSRGREGKGRGKGEEGMGKKGKGRVGRRREGRVGPLIGESGSATKDTKAHKVV